MRFVRGWVAIAVVALGCATMTGDRAGLDKIEHIVVIYAENRSFDHLYGLFPGANGLANATPEQTTQVDHDGTAAGRSCRRSGRPAPRARSALSGRAAEPAVPHRRAADQPAALRADRATSCTATTRTSSRSTAAGTTASPRSPTPAASRWATTTASALPMWKRAQEYTLADNFFMGAFGGSFLNHFWLVCACTPHDPHAPASERAQPRRSAGGWTGGPSSPRLRAARAAASFSTASSRPTATRSTRRSRRTSRAACRPAAGGDPALRRPGAATRCRRRRRRPSATRCRPRACRGPGTPARGTRRWPTAMQPPEANAQRDLQRASSGHDHFQPHHQPFNYFARFAPGTRRPRRAPEGLRRSAARRSTPARCRRSRSTSRRATSTSTPATPTSLSRRPAHRRRDRRGSGRARSGRRWR